MNRQFLLFAFYAFFAVTVMAQADQKLIEKANGGDAGSMVLLARCYETGAGVAQDSSKALQLLTAAAKSGDVEACMILSTYYLRGTLVEKDTARCVALRREYADKGEPKAMVMMAMCHLRGLVVRRDTAEAVRLLELAAKKGDSWGLAYMGDAYYYGLYGYKVDKERAVGLWKKSAKQGDWSSTMRLGDHYVSEGDYKKAWQYVNEGVRWRYPGSMVTASEMYFMGHGVATDEGKGQQIISDVCSNMPNYDYAYYIAGRQYMFPDDAALRDSAKAVAYWQRGDTMGSQACRYMLSSMMIRSERYTEAVEYLERILAQEGNDECKGEACFDLSRLYYMGWGVEESTGKMLDLLYRGADEYGYSPCARTVASFHSTEEGDKRAAELYYRRAIELGDDEAYQELADFYIGQGQISDAEGCYDEMIAKGNTDGYYYLTVLYANLGKEDKAKTALEKGVKKKNGYCLTMKGRFLEDGYDGKEPDYKKAAKYYEQAGTGMSLYRLGLLYINGHLGNGSEGDKARGVGYLQQSADMRYVDAIRALGYCYETGMAVGEKDLHKSLEYYQLLADNDVAEGIFKVGNFYESGLGGLAFDSVKAVECYRRAAMKGHGESMCYLGDFHRIGQFLPLDRKRAFYYYAAADSLGEVMGTYYVGRSYLEGCGVSVDTMRALPYLRIAAARGVGNAAYQLAEYYNYGKGGLERNGDSAVYYYWSAHHNGSADASLFIGRNYVREERYADAAEYFYTAARRGNYEGAVAYGVLQQRGAGMDADPVAAYSLFEQVARRGQSSSAYYQMGLARLNGVGCAQSEQLGKNYFDTAAVMGSLQAMNALATCYLDGYGCQPDTAEAVRWLERSVEGGSYEACNRLGNLYEAKASYDSAFRYFQLATDLGSLEGMCNLGYMYEKGHGVILSHRKAFELYSRAAENGYGRGFVMLAFCYLEGINVEEDATVALKWFVKGAEAGNVMGMYYAAVMYEGGENGVERDLKKAKYWYGQAASRGYEPAAEALKRL